ncbi:HEPN domain-containing protein [Synechocystis salina LEGE 06155]|nr:HEPN domain-containing protein [Synechocystis salina LEGE 06155]
MRNQQLALLVEYRLGQADETLREAKILLEQLAFRGSINRSYYAMFYATSALLATRQLGTSKHSGIISLFDR